MKVTEKSICLNCKASSKTEAVEKVGMLLVGNGNISVDYIKSMHEREKVANTYLGNGISIPHGMQKDRDFISKTGIAVLQIKEGVEWNPGEVVYLVFGIAAKSDEHIEILGNLTDLVNDPKLMEKLSKTDNAEDILKSLSENRNIKKTKSKQVKLGKNEKYIEAVVKEKTGLHARPASVFVELCRNYDAVIKLQNVDENEIVPADSMASILSLKVGNGDKIRIIASGKEADKALKELKEAVEKGLAEEDEEEIPNSEEYSFNPENSENTYSGVAASKGIAIAPVKILKKDEISFIKESNDIEKDLLRIDEAVKQALEELNDLYLKVVKSTGAGKAAIFKAHSEFLRDPGIVESVKKEIRSGFSAEWCWKKVYELKADDTEKLDDPILSARASDIRDIGMRVLKILIPKLKNSNSVFSDKPVILIADDLAPSDTVLLNPEVITGICTAKGGALSHTAIISRGLRIPAVVGAGEDILKIPEGELAVLDGSTGNLYIKPGHKDIENAQVIQKKLNDLNNLENNERFKPAITLDGKRIEIVGNIGAAVEAAGVVEAGGEGVGLLRTEFLFLNREEPPSVEEQVKIYTEMLKNLNGLPLTLRTLDIGGDKQISYINIPKEENPFLGVRGVRLCLKNMDLFKTQIRAVLKAAKYGTIRIMFPMISLISDIKKVKEILKELSKELDIPELETGIMVEVPSAVVMAEEFAGYVDFFSIGTNDLTQYTLAMDRGNTELAKQADGLNPAVLRMIKMTVKAAHKNGKWVGVCGDLAGDTDAAVLLAGIGVDELSMNIPSIAKVKMKLRNIKMSDAKSLADKALKCETAEEVRGLL